MKLGYDSYKDKVNACWIGKNIGGTMGTPYEGTRELLDIKGFVTKPGEVLPNDDLDLQMVWLLALEQAGPYAINTALLGEYWMSFITPHWNEYGLGKANMQKGLQPPMCGDYDNSWKDSNGAWIRTEIWASVAPGTPEAAARYAMEDAKVDHGSGEGTYAAAFVAAMQSAAFILEDIRACIELGLCVIPEESRVAKSVRHVIECYDSKKIPVDTRNEILKMNADIGNGWFEAPSNVAYTVLGLLYGEGDFKRSMILAINCGDDTDCTGATVGSTLGILGGMKAIPSDWREYLGDDIVTVSIARGGMARGLPDTCYELTQRVARMAPVTLFANNSWVELSNEDENEKNADVKEIMREHIANDGKLQSALRTLKSYSLYFETPIYEAFVTLAESPQIEPYGKCKLHIDFVNKGHMHEHAPYNLTFRWILPDGFTVKKGKNTIRVAHYTSHSADMCTGVDFELEASETVEAVNRCVLEVSTDARATLLYIPITLLG